MEDQRDSRGREARQQQVIAAWPGWGVWVAVVPGFTGVGPPRGKKWGRGHCYLPQMHVHQKGEEGHNFRLFT